MTTIEASTTTVPTDVTSAAAASATATTTAPAIRSEPSTPLPAQRTAPVRPRATWVNVTDPRTGRLGVEMRWWLPTATSVASAA